MKFTIHKYAYISTGYLETSDLPLLGRKDAPHHLAELDNGEGSFFWVPAGMTYRHAGEGDEELVLFISEALAFGFSQRFVDIMRELFCNDIQYVRFDADGGDVEGLEKQEE